MPERIDLDRVLSDARTPIDASWSLRKKAIVAGACALVSIAALGGGVWFTLVSRPPKLPTSADEALGVLKSDAYQRLDEGRQRQYAAEAQRLLRGLTPEERRRMLGGSDNEDLRRELREQWFDDLARRVARGEEPEFPDFRNRPRGERPRFQDMTEEERDERRRKMLDRAKERIAEALESGNAQATGLRTELIKKMGGRRGGGRRGGRRRR